MFSYVLFFNADIYTQAEVLYNLVVTLKMHYVVF